MSTHFFLVRHGETTFNHEGRVQGWLDVPLNEHGLQQAERIAHRLTHDTIHAIYSSDLSRARVTAEAIGQALNLPVQLDERLREHMLGEIQGLNSEEIREKFPERFAQQAASPLKRIPAPGEEPLEQFAARAQSFMQAIAAKHPEQNVVAVSHGGTLHLLLALYLGMDLQRPFSFHFGNASLSKVSYDGRRFRVYALNDTHHLPHI
jgi:probable phosphoglycerate mutase